ncbi:hypothetical protein NP233_g9279 [Leucocoprinus birnbaumii]|uniref:Uncharacterized protein n=1 Tax=Leucocoprinus birnbaumii TaxID=56174 RepID=A0AAD5YNC0_9AGAR|nr:hypothetical protein NP233_g9279 [Leucocoprinus birnbaumii]
MGSPANIHESRSQLNSTGNPQSYIEVTATMMPKRTVGLKHMLRPACHFLPMPMSLGWQEDPIDDDYPQRLLLPGLQLTDIDSGATRTVVAPWMHALYSMTYEELPSGVMEVQVEEAQFTNVFDWQHLAVVCVLCIQGLVGLWALAHSQRREGALILLGITLQLLEGYFAFKFPKYKEPRHVARARKLVLHKGMTTTHFLLISHQPSRNQPSSQLPYLSLEDASVPMPYVRKGYQRFFETTFRAFLQLGNLGLKLGAVFSQAEGLLIPFTLLFGTLASELIMIIRTPLPKISYMSPLETARERSSILDMVTAICQKTGCVSVGFVESVLPDREGTHVDFQWLSRVLESEVTLAAGVHPTHQTANVVLRGALQRRTQVQRVGNFTSG